MDLDGFDTDIPYDKKDRKRLIAGAQITKDTEMTDRNIDLSQIRHGGNKDKRNPV